MATIASLSPEILYKILIDAHLSNSDLVECSLVCRTWTAEAQRSLYHTLYIRDERSLRSLVDSPALGRYPTKKLTLKTLNERLGLDLVERCYGLESFVVLDVRFRADRRSGPYEWLQSESMKGLRHLELHVCTQTFPVDFPALVTLKVLHRAHTRRELTEAVTAVGLAIRLPSLKSLQRLCLPTPKLFGDHWSGDALELRSAMLALKEECMKHSIILEGGEIMEI